MYGCQEDWFRINKILERPKYVKITTFMKLLAIGSISCVTSQPCIACSEKYLQEFKGNLHANTVDLEIACFEKSPDTFYTGDVT